VHRSRQTQRDPVNELYDRGCDLVEAAAAIRVAATSAEAVRAVPAVLGCMEAALDALAQASIELQATFRGAPESTPGSAAPRADRGIAHLENALCDAQVAAAAARALAARAVARSECGDGR
jgi:hypothetical protein